jgi:uncharacterized protein (UPF0332 family)
MVYEKEFKEYLNKKRIRKTKEFFKVKLFLDKAQNSLLIAMHHKNSKHDNPSKLYWNYWAITISYYSMLYAAKAAIISKGYSARDHDSVQIALGFLMVPGEIEKQDLELLNQSYKIFEDEYVKYFEDAKKESYIARYSAIKSYTQRRLDEIFENARKFIAKISLIVD